MDSRIAFALLAFAPALCAQARLSIAGKGQWVAENAIALRTIDPRDGNSSDLEFLKERIGNARVVFLGQQSNKGAASAQAKLRLLRFLHEAMGFNVLASTLPVFDAEIADRMLDAGKIPGKLLREGSILFREATLPKEAYDYARATRKTARPLRLAGLGYAISRYQQWEYIKPLFRFIDEVDPAIASAQDRSALRKWIAPFGRSRYLGELRLDEAEGIAAAARLLDRLTHAPAAPGREAAFFAQTLANLAASPYRGEEASGSGLVLGPGRGGAVAFRWAAARLAGNLAWLAEKWHPESKIVVWADNRTIAYRQRGVARDSGEYAIAATTLAREEDLFLVLRAGPKPSLEPGEASVEGLLHGVRKPYLFLELRNLPPDHWLREPIAARILDGTRVVAAWPPSFDAVLFVDMALPGKGK